MAPSVTRQTALSRRRLALAACTLIATAIAFACSDLTPPPGAKLPHAPARTLDPGNVIVSPPNMHGWEFRDIENNSTCEAAGTCSLGKIVRGPATAPIGRGSGYLAVGTSTTSRKMALVTSDLSGTRLADITSLHYSSYRNSGGPYAVPIVFDVDYDLTDSVPGSQGIMIFLPTYTDTSLSPQGIWVDWDL